MRELNCMLQRRKPILSFESGLDWKLFGINLNDLQQNETSNDLGPII